MTKHQFITMLKQKLLAVGLLIVLTGAGQWLNSGMLWGMIVGTITYGIWSATATDGA